MKKLTTFLISTFFAFSLAACGDSQEAQFRKDYENFAKWQQAADAKINEVVAELQQKAAEAQQNPSVEQGIDVFGNFQNLVKEQQSQLESLAIKDPEVKNLAEKVKQSQTLTVEFFDFMINNAGKAQNDQQKLNELMATMQEKMNTVQALQAEVQQLATALDQKYRKK